MSKSEQSPKQASQAKKIIKKQVLQFFNDNPHKGYNYKQIAKALELEQQDEREKLLTVLEELFVDGYLDNLQRGRYKHKPQTQFAEGVIDMTRKGSGFLVSEDIEEDAFIAANDLKSAQHGDKVKVLLYARRKGKKLEGEVVEVLERRKTSFTGQIEVEEKFAFVVADDRRMVSDIFVPGRNINGAKHGEKVVVEIVEWPEGKSPVGNVVKILGMAGEHATEMHAIISEFELPTDFPDDVMAAAEAIPEKITKKEIDQRRDMRKVTTFTIDPVDAKDFDDALSIQKLDNGLWEIGIHIADVTHYVQEGSDLDKEALRRATSVYLVDRVIPMFPEKLSNQVCSLRPQEDKLCFSVVLELDEEAHIHSEWYGKTVIWSDRRFAYEEAQEVLETGNGDFANELQTLNALAKQLRKRKFNAGAISFETVEVKFELDEDGRPLRVIPKMRKEAHMLIEDFMLLANRKVAEFIFKKEKDWQKTPFVYRVHDAPPSDKLDNFVRIAKRFGHEMDFEEPSAISASFNKLLENLEGRPEQNMLQALAIRTMSKAFYTTKKSSHYGLAFDYYTHFTSPIRRYPDVIAHRLLFHYLHDTKKPDQEKIEEECKHSSEMEIKAAEAERASIKYKQAEYIKERLGEEFVGIISGVTEWGIYVEIIENRCEGMVRLSELEDDYYSLDEENYRIVGTNTGKVYRLGDHVNVRPIEANLQKRTIDLEFVEGTHVPSTEEKVHKNGRQDKPPYGHSQKSSQKNKGKNEKKGSKKGSSGRGSKSGSNKNR